MNKINAHITDVKTSSVMSLVYLKCESIGFQIALLGQSGNAFYSQKGNNVQMLFKETAVSICPGNEVRNSVRNRIPGTLKIISQGILFSNVQIDSEVGLISAIIASEALRELGLKDGDEVVGLISSTEIMLSH